jgi:hypothetical protein
MKVRVGLALASIVLPLTAATAVAEPVQPHPGDAITVEGGGSCTLGFLFAGSDRAAYMSTAGHCVQSGELQRRTWPKGEGPVVSTDQGRIGRIVFAENAKDPDVRDDYDFALVRLDAGVTGSPAIRSYGAPVGVNDEQAAGPHVLRVYGHGVAVSLVSRERQLIAPNTRNKDHVYAHGPLLFGDSGAPVIDEDGRAVGTVLGAGLRFGSGDVQNDLSPNIIGRLGPVVKHASDALRIRLVLRTR